MQAAADVAHQVEDDFDIEEEDGSGGGGEVALLDRPEVQEKLRRRISSCNVKVRGAASSGAGRKGWGRGWLEGLRCNNGNKPTGRSAPVTRR